MPKKFYDINPPKEEIVVKEIEPVLKKKRKGLFFRGFVLVFFFLILVLFFGFFFFSKVEIEIWPKKENIVLKKEISVDPERENPDFENGLFPVRTFDKETECFKEFSSTGRLLKEEKARGFVTIFNEYSTSERAFVPSRFVSADGKLFWSTEKIRIPGASYEKGRLVPGQVDVEVVAAEPGEEYNIGPSTFALPALAGSPLYTTIYAKSSSPMTGGSIKEVFQVSQEDLDKAEEILTEEARVKGREDLKNALPSDFILIEETIYQEVVESCGSLEAGSEGDFFDCSVKVKSEGLALKKSDIEVFAERAVSLIAQKNQKLRKESLEVDCFSDLLEIKGVLYEEINDEELKRVLLGKSLQEAEVFLRNFQEIEKLEIKSWPFLKKKISDNPERLKVKVVID